MEDFLHIVVMSLLAIMIFLLVGGIFLHSSKVTAIQATDTDRVPVTLRVDLHNPPKYQTIPYYIDLNIADMIGVAKTDGSEIKIRVIDIEVESRRHSCPRVRVRLDVEGKEHFVYCGMIDPQKGGIGPIGVAGVKIGVEVTQLVFSKIGKKKSRLNSYDNFKLTKDLRLAVWDSSKPIMKNAIDSFIVNQPVWARNKFGNWLHRTNYGLHSAIDIYATRHGIPEEVRSPVNGIIYRIYNKDADSDSIAQMKSVNIYSDDVVGPEGEKILFRFMHFSEILVSNGDHVKKGQVIGLTGHTGFDPTIGDHLHFEIRLNPSNFGLKSDNNLFETVPVNPYFYLLEWWENSLKDKQKAKKTFSLHT